MDNRLPVTRAGAAGGIEALAEGVDHDCALTTAGGVWCWGDDYRGQLGDGSFSFEPLDPVQASGLASGVVALVTGAVHAWLLALLLGLAGAAGRRSGPSRYVGGR